MAVVSVTELQNFLSGIKMTPAQKADAETILDGVQSELELYINRPLQQRRVMEEHTPDAYGRVYLRLTPIAAVYGVYYRNSNGSRGSLLTTELPGNFFERGGNFLNLGAYVAVFVDYLGGVNGDLHPGVKKAIKTVAAREYLLQHGDGVSIEGTEVRDQRNEELEPGWTEEELTRFDRIRRRVVVT